MGLPALRAWLTVIAEIEEQLHDNARIDYDQYVLTFPAV